MKTTRWLLLTPILVAACLFILWIFDADYLARPWLFINPSPVPSYAMNIQTPISSMDDDLGLRRTEFETDQPVGTIQQYYRVELPKRGWRYRCTVRSNDPPCGNWSLDTSELADVYDRGTAGALNWSTFEIRISIPDAGGIRKVWLYDGGWGGRVFPIIGAPTTPGHLAVAILGNWRATDDSSSTDFILRFYEEGRVRILFPSTLGENVIDGEYEWAGNGDLRLIFHWYFQPVDSDNSACKKYSPSFLKGFCLHTVVKYDPGSYPEPEVSLNPYPSPVQSPSAGAIDQIDEFFSVNIDGDMLTLTHRSGATQTFHRVTGD